jgi:hypothetical protein
MNFGKTVSKQHQSLTGVIVENAESCFVIRVEGMRREEATRKRDRNSEHPSPT